MLHSRLPELVPFAIAHKLLVRRVLMQRIELLLNSFIIIEFFMVVAFAGTLILLNPSFNSSMLLRMYQECHLTAFGQFTPFIQMHLKNSRKDRSLLNALKSMDEILVMGSALPEDEVEWATTNKIPLMVST